MHLHPDEVEPLAARRVPKAAGQRILGWIEQRIATRKPAAYLVNKMYMRGLPFYVDERVIVPRSFIGELLDSHFGDDDVLRLRDPATVTRVLDLCTGSGCLAILAARAFPNATVDAADLSADALAVAARNVHEHGLDDRITLAQGDLFAAVRGKRYDLIISNPPYVDAKGMAGLPHECLAEPRMAFDGGADGIDLVRRIIDGAQDSSHTRRRSVVRGRPLQAGDWKRPIRARICSGSTPRSPRARCSGSRPSGLRIGLHIRPARHERVACCVCSCEPVPDRLKAL